MKKLTQEEFIAKAISVHGDKFDYSKTIYVNTRTKVTIICKVHGEFLQTPNAHISQKQGCPVCSSNVQSNTEEFITKSIDVHGTSYDYSKVEYISTLDRVTIICPVHSEFEQSVSAHLGGSGCPKCNTGGKGCFTVEEFIEKAQIVHNNNGYKYDKVNYINNVTKVTITCQEHGDFDQVPSSHLSGKGCPQCGANKRGKLRSLGVVKFIAKVKAIHNDFYTYTKVVYLNNKTKVKITCPIHGDFEQTPKSHIRGRGCPCCAKSGFDPSKPGTLYYLKVTAVTGLILYKIGVTNKSVNERFKLTDLQKIEVIKLKLYNLGREAYDEEQCILKKYKQYKYIGPDVLSSGNTELFIKDVLSVLDE